MPSIKEVARMAGVSVATVSRFINHTAAVNEETADRISSAIKALDYMPNRLGRSLRTTRSNYILVLTPSIDNSFLSRVIRGIQNAGGRMGYSVLMGITQSREANENSYLNLVRSRGVDGVISISPVAGEDAIKELSRDFPIVQCSEYCTPDIPYVTIDNRSAAYEITEFLIRRCGCRRPALITSDLPIISFREREQGYLSALRDNGIEPEPSRIIAVPLGFETGKKAAERLAPKRPDGVLAVADILALGAMRYFQDVGLRAPQDISVAGFDGIPMAREFSPSLTTVIQPAFEMGKVSCRHLIDRIEGKTVAVRTLLPYRIARRQSTAGGEPEL